jgi:nickel transport protein
MRIKKGQPKSIMFYLAETMGSLKIGLISLVAAVLLLLPRSQALAHNVTVFAWVERDTVHVESKFSGGRRPMDAPVEVYDTGGHLLLKGVTDNNGEFSFKVPKKTEMKVVVLAGMGHKGEWTIPLSDLEDGSIGTPSQAAGTGSQPPASTNPDQAQSASDAMTGNPVPAGYVTAAEIRNAVEGALDTKLKPVLKLLVETQPSGPSVTDILGGIGYIFGLIGVAAYFSSKRRKS